MKNNDLIDHHDNMTQGRFTNYLLLAINRQKIRYLTKKSKIQLHELNLDEEIFANLADESVVHELDNTLFSSIEFPSDELFVDLIENEKILRVYLGLSEKEKLLLFLKVFKDKSYHEISDILGSSTDVLSNTFYRIMKKFRKEGK